MKQQTRLAAAAMILSVVLTFSVTMTTVTSDIPAAHGDKDDDVTSSSITKPQINLVVRTYPKREETSNVRYRTRPKDEQDSSTNAVGFTDSDSWLKLQQLLDVSRERKTSPTSTVPTQNPKREENLGRNPKESDENGMSLASMATTLSNMVTSAVTYVTGSGQESSHEVKREGQEFNPHAEQNTKEEPHTSKVQGKGHEQKVTVYNSSDIVIEDNENMNPELIEDTQKSDALEPYDEFIKSSLHSSREQQRWKHDKETKTKHKLQTLERKSRGRHDLKVNNQGLKNGEQEQMQADEWDVFGLFSPDVEDNEKDISEKSIKKNSCLDEENCDTGSGDISLPVPTGILPESTRTTSPIVRVDSGHVDKNNSLTKLDSVFQTCDTCMVSLYNSTHQCPYYQGRAIELEKWTREYVTILKNGCAASGSSYEGRCCHSPMTDVEETINDLTTLTMDLYNLMKRQCNKCPVDCEWGQWSAWSECPLTCERGHFRYRIRSEKGYKYGGRPCNGVSKQEEPCPEIHTYQGLWDPWSPWSSCSSTCGGTKTRYRKCVVPDVAMCVTQCPGDSMQMVQCDQTRCCKPRVWSGWAAWSSCARPEGRDPVRTRHRTCGPQPEFPDDPMCTAPCPGQPEETEKCHVDLHCRPRSWGEWEAWSPCSKEDGRHSYRMRWRSCGPHTLFPDDPMCADPCPGEQIQKEDCPVEPECIDGRWSQWSRWSPCNTIIPDLDTGEMCGAGCRNRSRKWLQGNYCGKNEIVGDHVESMTCQLPPCCVPPQWTAWGSWGACSVVIGQGRQSRRRQCQPLPQNWRNATCTTGGCNNRPGTEESRICYGQCPKPCETPFWQTWSSWGQCDPLTNRRGRTRRCQNPSQHLDHCRQSGCSGKSLEQEECCETPFWQTWGSWGQCDPLTNRRGRTRRCQNPSQHLDHCRQSGCSGKSLEQEECCETPFWQTWASWGQCDPLTNRRDRTRRCQNPSQHLDHCRQSRCSGKSLEQEECCETPFWQTWGSWGQCDPLTHRRDRTRRCQNPSQHLDHCRQSGCSGESLEQEECCVWAQWTTWSNCVSHRGQGLKHRTRGCRKRTLTGWKKCSLRACIGPHDQTQWCPLPTTTTAATPTTSSIECPFSLWTTWSSWSECNSRGYDQVRSRSRTCRSGRTLCPKQCRGHSEEIQTCCDSGSWGPWREWGECDCIKQQRSRERARISNQPSLRVCSPQFDVETQFCVPTGCSLHECEEETCFGRQNDEYPSCQKGCQHFVRCCEGREILHKCQGNQHFNSECRKCVRAPSSTCLSTGYDKYLKSKQIPYRTCE